MKTPGITVRPIQTIDGSHEVNEVFFDDVKVPVENRIYEENKGWDCAKFLLGNERSGIARVGASKAQVRRLSEIASMERVGDKPLIEDERFAMKIAAIEVELKALEMTQLRVVAAERNRKGNKPDPASSILKIKGSEIQQDISELLMEAIGPYALPDQMPHADDDRWNEPPIGPDYARAARAAILQLAQDLDLWRLERDPEEHHREGDIGTLDTFLPRERQPHCHRPRRRAIQLITRRPVITGCPACAGHDDSMRCTGHHGLRTFRRAAPAEGQRRAPAPRSATISRRARNTWPSRTAGAARCGSSMPSSACTALPFAEEHGGIGGGPVETMIVMEAFGRALALEPYFATVVLGGGFLRRGASDAVKRRRCCRRSRPARRCCRSRMSSGRRATTSPTSRRRRGRTAPATCWTAQKSLVGAWRLRRQADRLGARLGRRSGRRTASGCSWSTPRRRACRAAAIRPWTACAPPR